MGLETFLFQNKAWGRHNNCLLCETLHRVFTAVHRVRITSQLLYDNKIFCTMLFSIDVQWNAPSWNWWNCLLDLFKCSLKIVLRNLPFERLFVTFWKLIHSHAVTPHWLDDAKECNQSVWSKQHDCCSSAHEILAVDAGCFESCISQKLFGD